MMSSWVKRKRYGRRSHKHELSENGYVVVERERDRYSLRETYSNVGSGNRRGNGRGGGG